MKPLFILTTVGVALALGVISAATESRLLLRIAIVGFMPTMWAVSHAIEHVTGRGMWHFSAPYPYRWMRHRADTATLRPRSGRNDATDRRKSDELSRLPLAA